MNFKITLAALLLTAGSFTTQAQSVKKHGQLQVDGTQLKDQQGEALTLRGMSFGWHNYWPRFYTPGTVKWLRKDWKSSVVRAAMGVEPRNGYLEKPEWSKEKVKAVVDAAIQEDMYVIIDWHSHNINLEEAKEFFAEMARTYGHRPNVIYEIFNEPDEESWDEVKAYSKEVISTIRAIDPDNIILVGTPHWDQDIHLAADAPITGFDNLMYTVHFYAATHKQSLRDRCDYALSKGLPLFISESAGMEATGDGPLDEKEWQNWIDWAEKNKVSWVTWSVSDKDETCSILLPNASSDGRWKKKDLKASGIKSRELLRSYSRKK
ncbi:endoglucanase [Pontibacter ummariensis]|uniref:Endoglucanase n=1 Tax=Pontibacter ummariensis TaxID=1610492 RepID=A0A239JVF9_9BACT|nr:glycoside hydrolase family 5 protein [Pontibacter ummariensis]PRY07414.1 endoglucanase [Pontibacter ummariensis]SNT08864.1 endoglucanase [Pontibacter ummariensis]